MMNHATRRGPRPVNCSIAALAPAFVLIVLLPTSRPAQGAQTITETGSGITVSYPDGWTAGTGVGHIGILNYKEEEHPGPIPPAGGATIRIRVMPDVAHLDKALHARARSLSAGNARTSMTDSTIRRVDYDSQLGDHAFHESFVGVVKGGIALWIHLEYNAEDPQGISYQQVLTDLVDSISVVGPAATPTAPPSRYR